MIQSALASPLTAEIGWALLHFLWQGVLLAALLELALVMTRSAPARHNWALAALLAMAAAPVATFFLLHVPQLPDSGGGVAFAVPGDIPAAPAVAGIPAGPAPAAIAPPAMPSPSMLAPLLSGPWISWLVLCWFAGMAGLSLRALAGWWMVESLRRREVTLLPSELLARCQELQRSLAVTRTVRFLQSARVSVPVVIGWVRPAILVPAAAIAGLSPQHLEALIRHELAHIRRHDALINLAQLAVETILFYHPAVWHVSRRIRIERENCCDDLAVSGCGDAVLYVEALTALEAGRLPPGLVLAAHGGHLRDRAARLLGVPARPRRYSLPALAGLLFAGLVAGTVALAQPGTELKQTVPVAAKAVEKAIQLVLATPPRLDLAQSIPAARPARGPVIGQDHATLAEGEKIVHAGSDRVMLKVRIAEMSRSDARQFSGSGVIGAAVISAAKNAQEMLDGLERAGQARMLADTNLTAVSGETARFRKGGEFPVPTGRDRDGKVTVEFKPYGVGLAFTPMVMSPERISIQLATEVSEVFNTGANSFPALGVRRTETSVELPSGGSFAIAGLLLRNIKQAITGLPGASNQNGETELVVLVSADLVQPNAGSAPPLQEGALPTTLKLAQAAPASALDRITRRAENGDASAQTILGLRALDTNGSIPNPAEAAKWLSRAAEQGQAVAQYRLGTLYERGQGVAANPGTAARWYQAAANQGNRLAMYNLAVALANRSLGQPNMTEAARWFARAAGLGISDAQFNLAVLYERGDGVPQSLVEAYKWYSIAGAAGYKDAKERAEVLGGELSETDRIAAQRSAAAFRAQPLARAANVPPDPAAPPPPPSPVREGALPMPLKLAKAVGTTTPARYRVSEIFLPVASSGDEARVKTDLENIEKQIRTGASFRNLARQHSRSTSADQGGEMGWINDGQLEPDLNAVVASLQIGELSKPVRGKGGWYLLGMQDRTDLSQSGVQPIALKLAQAAPQRAAPVISNETPYSASLRCLSDFSRARPLRIGVGRIADYSDGAGRMVLGANLMAMAALAKAGVPMVERLDTSAAEIQAGSIPGSDFYVVGDVNELNFNIRTENGNGNGSLAVMNIGMDLRLVNSATKEVVDVVSLKKQIIGRQVSPGVFSFLGASFNAPMDEKIAIGPVQLALRAGIERGVMQMVGKAYAAPAACPVAVDYLGG